MAASSPISMRPQQQMHRSSGSNNLNINQPGQGPYRMSFSPSEREYHQQQSANASTYSGIVGNAARTIFGSSDDEGYLVSLYSDFLFHSTDVCNYVDG
jgi:hypothetical protein